MAFCAAGGRRACASHPAGGTLPDYFFHQDDQGNVVLVTDADGFPVERYEYDVFGYPTIYEPDWVLTRSTSAIKNPYLWNGRRWDADTKFYHYRFRDYDPTTGRLLQRDPLGVWGDLLNLGNATAYVGNNPWTYVDPNGLCGGPGGAGNAVLHWHHMIPKTLFAQSGHYDAVKDFIHEADYGVMLPPSAHSPMHPRYEDNWRRWLELQERHGMPVTADSVKKRVEQLRGHPDWSRYLESPGAQKATGPWPGKARWERDLLPKYLEQAKEARLRANQDKTLKAAEEARMKKKINPPDPNAPKKKGKLIKKAGKIIAVIPVVDTANDLLNAPADYLEGGTKRVVENATGYGAVESGLSYVGDVMYSGVTSCGEGLMSRRDLMYKIEE